MAEITKLWIADIMKELMKLNPIDNEAFKANPAEFYAVCANVETGGTEYMKIDDLRDPVQLPPVGDDAA